MWYVTMFILGYLSRPLLEALGQLVLKMFTEAWRNGR